jgi:hypothetical protein
MNSPEMGALTVEKYFKWVVAYTAIIALCIGLLRLVYVNCLPRLAPRIDFIATIILMIGVGVLLLVMYDMYVPHAYSGTGHRLPC